MSIKRAGELIIMPVISSSNSEQFFTLSQFLSNDIMQFKVACVLLLAVAAQTQFIGTGYPSLLPAATSLQVLPQGQPFPSIFNPVYPHQVINYRGIAVGSAGAPRYFYNPYIRTQTVQVSADVKDAGADTGAAAGSSRTRRQIQLRYGGRRGRSLNEIIEPKTGIDYESVDASPSRAKRQIQLRYRSGYGGQRRGRSLNEPVSSAYPVQFELDRAKRQIQLRYRSSARRRHGRSLETLWTTA